MRFPLATRNSRRDLRSNLRSSSERQRAMQYKKPIRGPLLLLLAGLCQGEALSAQQAVVLPLGDLKRAMDAGGTKLVGGVGAIARLARIATEHAKNLERARQAKQQQVPGAPRARTRRPIIKHHESTDSLLVSGDDEFCGWLQSVVTQLRKPEARELRLACTIVSMPEAVAEECGLLVGRVLPVDEVKAGQVQKAAILAKGTLQNLPETLAVPLLPFRIERHPDREKPGDAPAGHSLRLRGEAVLFADDQAVFSVQLAAELPKDPTVLPTKPLLSCTMPLVAGSGVIVRTPVRKDAPQNEAVVAVWLRFLDVVPAKQPQSRIR